MSVKIQSVQPHSPAARAGIRPGELLLEIDGNGIEDFLDYRFLYGVGKRKPPAPVGEGGRSGRSTSARGNMRTWGWSSAVT